MVDLIVADGHDSPSDSKERWLALGKFARHHKVDRIFDLGDRGTFDSVSSHCVKGSLTDKKKNSIKDELQSVRETQAQMNAGLGRYKNKCAKYLMVGNHEERLDRFVEANPELEGILNSVEMYKTFPEFKGWNIYPYMTLLDVGKYIICHVAPNSVGKPIAGMYSTRQAGMLAHKPIFFGHRHKFEVSNVGSYEAGLPKMGVSCPCFMREGHIENYALGSLIDWDYGVLLVSTSKSRALPVIKMYSTEEVLQYV